MKLSIITFIVVIAFNLSYADDGLNNLRQSFNSKLNEYVKNLDLCAAIKPIASKLGHPISLNKCESIAQNIKYATKIDPFEFIYEGGSSTSSMCGGQWG